MESKNNSATTVSLEVEKESVGNFTTLLQGGIFLTIRAGTSIGELLNSLSGFTQDYIHENVETIFINGLPADDLSQQLFRNTTIAVSAAMPGLAGAIFRKNSIHASLRTRSQTSRIESQTISNFITVRLKLFNLIATQKGALILSKGCTVLAATLKKFLTYRPTLTSLIKKINVNGNEITITQLVPVLDTQNTIRLTITYRHNKQKTPD